MCQINFDINFYHFICFNQKTCKSKCAPEAWFSFRLHLEQICASQSFFFFFLTTYYLRWTRSRHTQLQHNEHRKHTSVVYNLNIKKKKTKNTPKSSKQSLVHQNPNNKKQAKITQTHHHVVAYNNKTDTHATPHPQRLPPHPRPSHYYYPNKPNIHVK